MAEARQRVVLAEDRDDGLARPRFGDERGLEPTDATAHVDLLGRQELRQALGGEALLERELRMLVDLERQPIERSRACIDPLADPSLLRRQIHSAIEATPKGWSAASEERAPRGRSP